MKLGRLAGWIGGAVIIGLLVLALLYGLQTPAIVDVLDPLGQSLANAGDAARGLDLPSLATPAAGDPGLSAGVALAGFAVTTILVPVARSGRGLVVSAVLWTLVGLVLYAPGVFT